MSVQTSDTLNTIRYVSYLVPYMKRSELDRSNCHIKAGCGSHMGIQIGFRLDLPSVLMCTSLYMAIYGISFPLEMDDKLILSFS